MTHDKYNKFVLRTEDSYRNNIEILEMYNKFHFCNIRFNCNATCIYIMKNVIVKAFMYILIYSFPF
jgi:hypothetical protein